MSHTDTQASDTSASHCRQVGDVLRAKLPAKQAGIGERPPVFAAASYPHCDTPQFTLRSKHSSLSSTGHGIASSPILQPELFLQTRYSAVLTWNWSAPPNTKGTPLSISPLKQHVGCANFSFTAWIRQKSGVCSGAGGGGRGKI